jgi:hypothetical protein
MIRNYDKRKKKDEEEKEKNEMNRKTKRRECSKRVTQSLFYARF